MFSSENYCYLLGLGLLGGEPQALRLEENEPQLSSSGRCGRSLSRKMQSRVELGVETADTAGESVISSSVKIRKIISDVNVC